MMPVSRSSILARAKTGYAEKRLLTGIFSRSKAEARKAQKNMGDSDIFPVFYGAFSYPYEEVGLELFSFKISYSRGIEPGVLRLNRAQITDLGPLPEKLRYLLKDKWSHQWETVEWQGKKFVIVEEYCDGTMTLAPAECIDLTC